MTEIIYLPATDYIVRARMKGASHGITRTYVKREDAEEEFGRCRREGVEYVGLFRRTPQGRVLLIREAP